MSADLQPSPETDWTAAAGRLARASVLVVGDILLDRYVYGQVERVSPEAPVPVLCVSREVALPGGAGNVVRNLTALGAAVAFVSIVGDDQNGSDLTGLIGGQLGVEPWLLVQGGRLTTVKSRFVAQGQQLLRSDKEDPRPVHAKLAERMIRIAHDAMAATGITVLSDYGQGVLAGDVAPQLIRAAKSLNRRVVVDPSGPNLARFAGADVITPSRRALAEAGGRPLPTQEAIVAAAEDLRQAHDFGAVLVCSPAEGLTLITAGGAAHLPAEAPEIYDVSGSRDALAATVAAGLCVGLPLPVAARLANIAAGIVVGKAGTAVARTADLLTALSPPGGALRKVVTRAVAEEQAERWRQRGQRIAFTNGVFDLLHPGHVHLLEQARARCDRLVVGVNGDAGARRLKGAGRPVQTEAARAAVVAGLSVVDLVVVFDEETPEAVLRALRPDLLVKGGDYTMDSVVGAELMQEWGGRVLLADLLPGHSTTATVTRLRG